MDKYIFKTENFKLQLGKRFKNTDMLLEEVDRKFSFSGDTASVLVSSYLHERINVLISWEFVLLFFSVLSLVSITLSHVFMILSAILICSSLVLRFKTMKEIKLISFNLSTIMSMASIYNQKTDEE